MLNSILVVVAGLIFSVSGFAHQIHCAGLDQNSNHRIAMDIREKQAQITSSTLQTLVGQQFPVMGACSGSCFYDMKMSLGQQTLLLVQSELARKITAGGSAEIRGRGPNGTYIHFYCRQIRYPLHTEQ